MPRLPGIVVWLLLLPAGAVAQRQMTVPQLVTFIQSSIQMQQQDRQVADIVRKVKLTNRLDPRTVEDLEGKGAGPRTVAALRELSQASAALPAPPPQARPQPAVIPAPGAKELQSILAAISENAVSYTNTLPNFICTQVTRRHRDPTGTDSWRLEDTIQEHLSYVDHHEDYKVVMVNDRLVTGTSHQNLGGAKSQGEFGSMLDEIFRPQTHAQFDWERWATLRGRRMYVFMFYVKQAYSKYSIYHQDSNRTIVTGYHGLIYADHETKMVMRVRLECDTIPADFPVQQVSEVMDYDFVKIGDQRYVLPLKVDMRSREAPHDLVWNEIEFHLYRKFGADASISFDPVDPIPENQLREQPAK